MSLKDYYDYENDVVRMIENHFCKESLRNHKWDFDKQLPCEPLIISYHTDEERAKKEKRMIQESFPDLMVTLSVDDTYEKLNNGKRRKHKNSIVCSVSLIIEKYYILDNELAEISRTSKDTALKDIEMFSKLLKDTDLLKDEYEIFSDPFKDYDIPMRVFILRKLKNKFPDYEFCFNPDFKITVCRNL